MNKGIYLKNLIVIVSMACLSGCGINHKTKLISNNEVNIETEIPISNKHIPMLNTKDNEDTEQDNVSVSNIIPYIPSGTEDINTRPYKESMNNLTIVPESLGIPSHNGEYFADWYDISLAGYKGIGVEISYPNNIINDPLSAFLNHDDTFNKEDVGTVHDIRGRNWEVYAETDTDDEPFTLTLFNIDDVRQYVSFTLYMADGIKADDMTADLAERLINAI